VASSVPGQVVRRSGRIPQQIPILLIGTDLEGKIFSERTSTVLLSLHGASVVSKHKLSSEQELVLRWPAQHKEADVRVVGQLNATNHHFTYGVSFFDPQLKFWETEFPPASPSEQELGMLGLVCSSCQTLEKIDDSSFEADICAAEGAVLRYCKRCGCSTLWKLKQSGSSDLAQTQSAAPASLPVQVAGSASSSSAAPTTSVLTVPASANIANVPQVNRRKYPRVKVNYIALVRHPNRQDELVQCEDVSRGGLRFKTRTRYYEKALIEVAAPYSSGQLAIFVSAKIIFAQQLPEQNLFRYGVAFLKSIQPRDTF